MNKKGFSIVEILVTTAIAGLIMSSIFFFVSNVFTYNSFLGSAASAQQEAKKVVDKIVSELRTTSPSSAGDYPLAQTDAGSITFYANADTDSYIERIRYFTSGTKLRKGILKPSGNPLIYNPANEVLSDLINDISTATSTIFYYYDKNATATSTPLTAPVLANQVRLVKIDLWIDSNPSRSPAALEITSKVNLRNLKDN
jgi:prepilin-type N-terminal cleavage/methylation domain-containing protein